MNGPSKLGLASSLREHRADADADERFERRLFWRQVAIVVLVAALIVLLALVR